MLSKRGGKFEKTRWHRGAHNFKLLDGLFLRDLPNTSNGKIISRTAHVPDSPHYMTFEIFINPAELPRIPPEILEKFSSVPRACIERLIQSNSDPHDFTLSVGKSCITSNNKPESLPCTVRPYPVLGSPRSLFSYTRKQGSSVSSSQHDRKPSEHMPGKQRFLGAG